MKFLLLCVAAIACCSAGAKQNFCQENRCLTCVRRYCTTTCVGEECKKCPLGDCCNGTNCNICRGENCCRTGECNTCILSCLKSCEHEPTCHHDCFQKCNPNPELNRNLTHLISNVNYLPVNVTTIINITNTIDSNNSIHNPIIVNTTNFNNFTRKNSQRERLIVNDGRSKNCCQVVHPEKCHEVIGQKGFLCYTERHNECSQICVGKHVHIVRSEVEEQKCIVVTQSPYLFCSNYILENCDSCNNCTEGSGCLQNSDCSENCRISIIPDHLYNHLYIKG